MSDDNESNVVSSASNNPVPIPPGFLRDSEGKPSSIRLNSFIALAASILFGGITLSKETANSDGMFITGFFLLAAFAPKALQKFIENYFPKGS